MLYCFKYKSDETFTWTMQTNNTISFFNKLTTDFLEEETKSLQTRKMLRLKCHKNMWGKDSSWWIGQKQVCLPSKNDEKQWGKTKTFSLILNQKKIWLITSCFSYQAYVCRDNQQQNMTVVSALWDTFRWEFYLIWS